MRGIWASNITFWMSGELPDQRQGIKHSQEAKYIRNQCTFLYRFHYSSLPTRHQTQYLDCESTDQGFKRLTAVSEDNQNKDNDLSM